MTPDLDAVRAALAAARKHTGRFCDDYCGEAHARISKNATGWLEALCDEIERLRAALQGGAVKFLQMVAERNAALAEVELVRLTAFTLEGQRDAALGDYQGLYVKHEAALAECERLRIAADPFNRLVGTIIANQDAWRACAEKALFGTSAAQREALADYEHLKGEL